MPKPKNLLIIMSDEHQARAMSCAGHPLVKTPNLDALAARGVRFENAYTPSPICVPARAAFATGRYPHETGYWDNSMPYTGAPRGWGHALQECHIPVESIGKLHYRSIEDRAGFDIEHIPMHVAGGTGMVWASIRREGERAIKNVRMLGDYIGPGESSYTKYDRAVVAKTQEWLRRRTKSADSSPWCLYVGLVAPHFPLIVPQEFYDLYAQEEIPESKLRPRDGYNQHPWIAKQDEVLINERGFVDEDERRRAIISYFGLCSFLDHNIGQILVALDEANLTDCTTIIYTSDHGDNLGSRGLWGKSNMYEESVKVPLIVANGSATMQGICRTPVSLVDISQTILEHFNADDRKKTSGKSLYTIMSCEDDMSREAFSEYHAIGAVSGSYMVRKGRWKFIHYEGFDPELFDLDEDPEETVNLAGNDDFSHVLAEMKDVLHKHCDPSATNKQAFADQDALIARFGGLQAASIIGAPSATPPPKL